MRLTRPPNLLTAVSDIWAGGALSGYLVKGNDPVPVILLSLATIFLYGGGVVMNDVCDAELDAVERPERPIPSGIIPKNAAAVFGISLLIIGIILAICTSSRSGILAVMIAIASLIYDRWGKHHAFLGPLNMGICRGLNLLLGMSVVSLNGLPWVWVAIIPVLYIAAITLISRGEVHGGSRSSMVTAFIFYGIVILAIISVAILKQQLPATLLFLVLFGIFILPPLSKAMKSLSGEDIGKAVKSGVLGLILMNACWVAACAGWQWAVITALLLPLSIWVANRFAVT